MSIRINKNRNKMLREPKPGWWNLKEKIMFYSKHWRQDWSTEEDGNVV